MRQGIILLNMGGPNNLDEVELFLKNMFNDKNIISIKNDTLRSMVSFFISKTRKKYAIQNYKQIGSKSPIVDNTKSLVTKLQKLHEDKIITYAMAYTPPFCDEAIELLKDCEEVLVFPLYPQYSTTTVKTSLEDFESYTKKMKVDFKVKIVKEFYAEPSYNEVLINLIRKCLKNDKAHEFDLIFSAHSLPQKIIDKGDPYERQVNEHVDILNDLLKQNNLIFNKTHLAYQSKLGPVKWLSPELGEKLKNIENKKVIIVPLSFVIDNSETDFELGIEYKEISKDLGITDYRVCKCPNDDERFISFLNEIMLKYENS